MDLSALIFVALAVAWAVYLIPKALRHHDDVDRSRTVDRFSHTMRVLARREPVDRRSARLVVTPGRPASTVGPAVVKTLHESLDAREQGEPATEQPVVSAVGSAAESSVGSAGEAPAAAPVERSARPLPQQARARRQAAVVAARRRLRVFSVLLLSLVAVVGVAAFGVIAWAYVAVPAALVVAWLVACRLMVRQERSVSRPTARPVARPDATPDAAPGGPVTEEIAVVTATAAAGDEADQTGAGVASPLPVDPALVDPALWDPVPVTLPTYVTKPAATRRTVRTIDLDDTGVWTSGRSESDSQIAREADQAERADRAKKAGREDGDGHRAVGS